MKTCLLFSLFVLAYSQEACNPICPMHYSPVCGSNGVTYPNQCNLDFADCQSQDTITLDYVGECSPCKRVCPMHYDPQCGSDGVTYSNLCSLEVADCLSDEDITLNHPGQCVTLKEASCVFNCPRIYAPVCGSNGVTYSNQCMLDAADCHSADKITLAHQGKC